MGFPPSFGDKQGRPDLGIVSIAAQPLSWKPCIHVSCAHHFMLFYTLQRSARPRDHCAGRLGATPTVLGLPRFRGWSGLHLAGLIASTLVNNEMRLYNMEVCTSLLLE